MKALCIGLVYIWMEIIIARVESYNLPGTALQTQERAGKGFVMQTGAAFKKMVKSEQFQGGIPDTLSSLGGIGALATMDYDRPAREVIMDVGNAVVPILSAGLALIPGIGPIISGVVSGLFGIFSGLFGGKSPMERMVDELKDEIKNIKKHINMLAKEIPDKLRKETDAKLKSIVERAVHGELQRNQYICNKYAMISKDFSDDLKNNRTIRDSLRVEMLAYIQDCDNFLKDTAEAFVYPEFADVLWIPSAMVTLFRVSFLTEVTNYGNSLKMDKSIMLMFWSEIKSDIKRHFYLAANGVNKRLENLPERLDVFFTDSEISACSLQSHLIYLDREMYQYGIPKPFVISNSDSTLYIADYNVTQNKEAIHISAHYTQSSYPPAFSSIIHLLNCIYGPHTIGYMPYKMSFRVNYVYNKRYEVRLAYFVFQNEFEYTKDWATFLENANHHNMTVVANKEGINDLKITVTKGKPNENNAQRFLITSALHMIFCKAKERNCNSLRNGFFGDFIVENVASFEILSSNEREGRISIEVENELDAGIFGVELIALPI